MQIQRKLNFSAGPAALPQAVLERTQAELMNWRGCGASVMEISHRSSEFMQLREECLQRMRKLLQLPDNYQILFLPGGANLQFSMLPMNLLGASTHSSYLISGHWSSLAAKEAEKLCEVNRIDILSQQDAKRGLQDISQWQHAISGAYLHLTSNETIDGIAVPTPNCNIPVAADMSSCIMSETIDPEQYALIYACAQKNLGIAGITFVILNPKYLQAPLTQTPNLMNYKIQIEKDSMYNTPATFSLYISNLVLEWIEQQGGLNVMQQRNSEKASELYNYIDNSDFYSNNIATTCRSKTNVPFHLHNKQHEAQFLESANSAGIIGIKGHRAVGGMRASIYNATPIESVRSLIQFMDDFAKKNGN